MLRNGFILLAAGTLTLGLATAAMADSHAEPDCPEDLDTEPGCDLEGAATSEAGPVEGAATAPVPPDGDEEDGDKSMTGARTEETADTTAEEPDCPEDDNTDPGCQMEGAEQSEAGPIDGAATAPVPADGTEDEGEKTLTGPDADPAEGAESAQGEGQDDASAAPASEADPHAVAYAEDGRYFTADDLPTYNVSADGTVDWLTYSGFRRYHSECHVCHGPEGEGSSYAPALKDSVLRMDYYDFWEVVVQGRQVVNAAETSVMPAFGDNPNVMCYLDDIYVYLLARGTDAVPRGRPGSREEKSDLIRATENDCIG